MSGGRSVKATTLGVPAEIKTEEFEWAWLRITADSSKYYGNEGVGITTLGDYGELRLTNSLRGSFTKESLEEELGLSYLPLLPGVRMAVSYDGESPEWLKNLITNTLKRKLKFKKV